MRTLKCHKEDADLSSVCFGNLCKGKTHFDTTRVRFLRWHDVPGGCPWLGDTVSKDAVGTDYALCQCEKYLRRKQAEWWRSFIKHAAEKEEHDEGVVVLVEEAGMLIKIKRISPPLTFDAEQAYCTQMQPDNTRLTLSANIDGNLLEFNKKITGMTREFNYSLNMHNPFVWKVMNMPLNDNQEEYTESDMHYDVDHDRFTHFGRLPNLQLGNDLYQAVLHRVVECILQNRKNKFLCDTLKKLNQGMFQIEMGYKSDKVPKFIEELQSFYKFETQPNLEAAMEGAMSSDWSDTMLQKNLESDCKDIEFICLPEKHKDTIEAWMRSGIFFPEQTIFVPIAAINKLIPKKLKIPNGISSCGEQENLGRGVQRLPMPQPRSNGAHLLRSS